jgi:preprotein translocase subunit SecA
VEQAQERVEGNNFDVRKHLLEYDDVLNSQRKRIYAERDRAFQKDDLHDDVVEVLRTELNERIPKALADEEGPWKLLGYLEEVQPSMNFEAEGIRAPSYTVQLMVEELRSTLGDNADDLAIKNSLLEIAEQSLRAEHEHVLNATRVLLDKTEDTVDEISRDRLDTVDTFFEGLEDARGDEELAQRRPQELLEELSNLTRTQLRLSADEMRALPEADREVMEKIRTQVSRALNLLAITRTIGSVERRLDESLNLKPSDLQELDWEDVTVGILTQVNATLEKRTTALLAPDGQISGNIDTVLARTPDSATDENRLVDLLMNMSLGSRMAIDARTHQRGMKRVILVNYIFQAAHLIQDRPVAEITHAVLEHLERIQQRLETVWGRIEFERFRLSGATMQNLDPQIKEALRTETGDDNFEKIMEAHPDTLTGETREELEIILGRRMQNQIHRHILLSVISELWVDYLTRVDALRVSIGLEAFAQRDPLVQYKGQASEMFRSLLSDIRAGVISRMFLFQPRRPGAQAAERPAAEAVPQAKPESPPVSGEKKKKRKRH